MTYLLKTYGQKTKDRSEWPDKFYSDAPPNPRGFTVDDSPNKSSFFKILDSGPGKKEIQPIRYMSYDTIDISFVTK